MATTEIHVTAADNELVLIASTPAGSSELLHYKSGYNKPVEVKVFPGAILSHGTYSLTMLGVNWGGPSKFEVTVVTDGKPQKYSGGGSEDVGLAWSKTISITV